ncbi:unnamed protein product [Durusdinium trenchii]|uniref:SET domain-containing protein n=1 Tax=Durusdinium trenchii TaxID=1381693 RepID=A0ABP0SXC3_9DINO
MISHAFQSPVVHHAPAFQVQPTSYLTKAKKPTARAFFWTAALAPFTAAVRTRAQAGRCYEVRKVSDKGFGAIALEPIASGQLVAEEEPALRWSGAEDEAELQECFDALSVQQKEALLELEDAFAERQGKTILGIARTNAFQAGEPSDPLLEEEEESRVLYLELSRFNHSCLPNCGVSWDDREGMLQVYAERDIAAGEELCLYYQDVRFPTPVRQERLISLGFQCACPVCVAADPVSDERRARMQQLIEELEESEDEKALELIQETLRLYDEERLTVISYRKMAAYKAYAHSMSLGNLSDAARWAKLAYKYCLQCHGPYHAQTKVLRAHANRVRS